MRLLLAVALLMCVCGCTSRANSSAHWIDQSYWADGTGKHDRLVCDSSGKMIAEIMHSTSTDTFAVFGGNGAEYGEFQTEQEAKKQEESLQGNYFRMGSRWLNCP